ncbi:MAG: TIGR00282 family metallophosphoesterase [Pelagibacteraceae bacterium]|nr:TIGR00282 family metallophosphoesterase [Pelagibacteraceae bacterium]
MNILILGDVVGSTGREALKKRLKTIIKEKNIDFTVVNGENADNTGRGITKENSNSFFDLGVDVITSGNHIWDQKETMTFIENEKRLLRPYNLTKGSPGKGFGIFQTKNKKFKIAVINLMGNIFMKKCDDLFQAASQLKNLVRLRKDADFIIVDIHGEITSEKMALGHFFDGEATVVVGTHTHVPTSDTHILKGGTAYQTDLGMCGDYDSVIGMNKDNSLMRFFKNENAKRHSPALGDATISGIIVEADSSSGKAIKAEPLIVGRILKNF